MISLGCDVPYRSGIVLEHTPEWNHSHFHKLVLNGGDERIERVEVFDDVVVDDVPEDSFKAAPVKNKFAEEVDNVIKLVEVYPDV